MNTVQLGIRIPSNLNERLTTFMSQTGMSKTECTEQVSLNERVASLEAKMAVLKASVRGSLQS